MPESAHVGSNGFDEMVQGYVTRLENVHADIASIMSEALTKCRAKHGDIKEILTEAKDNHGLSKKVLRGVVKARAYERKADAVRDKLTDENEQDSFDKIRLALGDYGDTPLGAAALQRAGFTDGPSMADPPFSAPAQAQ